MSKPEPKKIVQSEQVIQAVAKMDEILARNKKKSEGRFKITPQMRHEAEMKALGDPKDD